MADILKDQIDKIANFNLAIFGICFTIFTVVYSFISTKKDSLIILNEELKVDGNNLISIKKLNLLQIVLKKWRRFNSVILVFAIITLLIYLSSTLCNSFIENKNALLTAKNILLWASILTNMIALFLFFRFIYFYYKETKFI